MRPPTPAPFYGLEYPRSVKEDKSSFQPAGPGQAAVPMQDDDGSLPHTRLTACCECLSSGGCDVRVEWRPA